VLPEVDARTDKGFFVYLPSPYHSSLQGSQVCLSLVLSCWPSRTRKQALDVIGCRGKDAFASIDQYVARRRFPSTFVVSKTGKLNYRQYYVVMF
jgi:hypothetical protein